jgi:hypothetical protein
MRDRVIELVLPIDPSATARWYGLLAEQNDPLRMSNDEWKIVQWSIAAPPPRLCYYPSRRRELICVARHRRYDD